MEPDVQQEPVNRQDFNTRYTKGFNMTVKIEKNIPVPEEPKRRGMEPTEFGTIKFVWLHQMDVGDSVRFNESKEAYAATSAANRLKKINKLPPAFKLKVQTVVENGGKFVRIWRTA